jgi:hypothetical protein
MIYSTSIFKVVAIIFLNEYCTIYYTDIIIIVLKKLTWIELVVKNPAALLDARKIKYT